MHKTKTRFWHPADYTCPLKTTRERICKEVQDATSGTCDLNRWNWPSLQQGWRTARPDHHAVEDKEQAGTHWSPCQQITVAPRSSESKPTTSNSNNHSASHVQCRQFHSYPEPLRNTTTFPPEQQQPTLLCQRPVEEAPASPLKKIKKILPPFPMQTNPPTPAA